MAWCQASNFTHEINLFQDMRERHQLPLYVQQEIYNLWLENSINSTDGGCHDRNVVKISKRKYHEQGDPDLSDGNIVIGEKCNKVDSRIILLGAKL